MAGTVTMHIEANRGHCRGSQSCWTRVCLNLRSWFVTSSTWHMQLSSTVLKKNKCLSRLSSLKPLAKWLSFQAAAVAQKK